MMNVCMDERDFYRTVLESLRDKCSDYSLFNGSFDGILPDRWSHVLETHLFEVVHYAKPSLNISVGCENVEAGGILTHGGLSGLHRLDSGELFYGFDCCAGWEVPVNAVIYVSDGQVRLYVPEKGNNFNEEFHCAYGSEPGTIDYDKVDACRLNKIDQVAELEDIANFFRQS